MDAKPNIVKEKSYNFAIRIIHLYGAMKKQNEYVLSRQLVRSGTSIGANIEEAIAAQSRKDFISKMAIASKEARETNYWLRLLRDTSILKDIEIDKLLADSEKLVRIITSIVKTSNQSNL